MLFARKKAVCVVSRFRLCTKAPLKEWRSWVIFVSEQFSILLHFSAQLWLCSTDPIDRTAALGNPHSTSLPTWVAYNYVNAISYITFLYSQTTVSGARRGMCSILSFDKFFGQQSLHFLLLSYWYSLLPLFCIWYENCCRARFWPVGIIKWSGKV